MCFIWKNQPMDVYFNIHVDNISGSWTIRRCTCKRNIEASSRNNCCLGKEISMPITYSECVPVALVTQHELRMHCIVLSSVAWSGCIIFSHTILF